MKKFLFVLSLIVLAFCADKDKEKKDEVKAEEVDDDYYNFVIKPVETFDKETLLKDKGKKKFDDTVTSKKVIDEMGFGWNLGNTFDAFTGKAQDDGLDSETCWGVTKTSEEIIEALAARGMKTIRIPASWHNHLIDDKYTVDPEFMARVKTVVDWALDKGLYVILNTHHDNAVYGPEPIKYGVGYYPLRKDMAESEKFLYNVWRQIAAAFNNGYDHHLIFEGLNEPRLQGTAVEWNYHKGEPMCEEGSSVLNEYLRLIVKAIRTSGGNNAKRFIMVTPLAAAYSSATTQDFIFPGDSKYNPTNPKILLSVHMYLPYNFAMNADMSYTTFEESYANELYSNFKSLYETFVLNGHHVVVGEMGTINKNNTEDRIAWAKYYIENSRKFQLSCILWDNQQFDNTKGPTETFGHYHRDDLSWEIEELMDAYIDTAETELVDNPAEEFGESLISSPVLFDEWLGNFFVGAGTLSALTSKGKFVFTFEEPEKTPAYRALHLFLGDWSAHLNFTKPELKGANVNQDGGIALNKGPGKVEVTMSDENLKLARERGLYIIGHGFNMTSIGITGPKLSQMEPLVITKDVEKKQKLNLHFSEDASDMVAAIKFDNFYHNLSETVECALDKKDKKLVVCSGLFDFTGDYYVTDEKGFPLTTRALHVVAKDPKDVNIKNLIDAKVNFDVFTMGPGITLVASKFADATKDSTIVIETDNIVLTPSYRALFLFNSGSVLSVSAADTNVEVGADGGLSIPAGRNFVEIKVGENVKNILKSGLTLKGYGFGIRTIYIRTPEPEPVEEEEEAEE